MVNITKVPAGMWLQAARNALIADGINGVKIDRLAKALAVSRGGFYHHFKNRQDLLVRLLDDWTDHNSFLPTGDASLSTSTIPAYLNRLVYHHISETKFSPAYEMAIRE